MQGSTTVDTAERISDAAEMSLVTFPTQGSTRGSTEGSTTGSTEGSTRGSTYWASGA